MRNTSKAAKPAAAKAAKPVAAKPAIVATPAKADATNETRERCIANRQHVQPYYGGASPVSHASRAPKLAEALARVATPVQRAKSATERDCSALVLAAKHCDGNDTFCPVAATADLGALSRLASLSLLTVDGNRVKLTKAGRDLANLTLKAKAS
jgi:hypothetical protein